MYKVLTVLLKIVTIMGMVTVLQCQHREDQNSLPHFKLNRTARKQFVYYPVRHMNVEFPQKHIDNDTYFQRFSTPAELIKIPLVINVDNAMLRKYSIKHGRNARKYLKNYIRNTVKDITRVFQHPTLGKNIVIEVYDINFLRNNSRVLSMSGNATEYLNSYCKWQARKKERDNTWYSVLLTGLDLYYVRNGTKVFANEARSFNNGMCNLKKSCTVAEGNTKNLAHRLTHEIAHSLGIRHDGISWNRRCPGEGYIMASRFNQDRPPYAWSKCSRDNLAKYLRSRISWCLK